MKKREKTNYPVRQLGNTTPLLLILAAHSPPLEVELTGTLRRSSEVIPIVPELTWYPSDLLLLLDIHTMSPANTELALYNK
jgi:hypothetical protein